MSAAARTLRPQAGAVANARDAVQIQRAAEQDRREAALELARAGGPRSWMPLRPPSDVVDAAPHGVCFHDDTADLLDRVVAYVSEGLADDELCLVVTSAGLAARLRQRLQAAGLAGTGQLVTYDVADVLPRIRRSDGIDVERFRSQVAAVLRGHAAAGRRIRAYGEMAGLLWAEGNVTGAMQLEQEWDQLQRELGIPVLCAYPLQDLQDKVDDGGSRICGLHSHLAGAGAATGDAART